MTPIAKLRNVARIEAISYLVLLFIAMPLKYLADWPLAVKIVGWIHGVLFVWFCVAFVRAHQVASWDRMRSMVVFGSSLVPFMPFWIDTSLARDDEALETGA